MTVGFRKLAAYVNKHLDYDTDIYYAIPEDSWTSVSTILFGSRGETFYENDEEMARRMAEPVADADIVGFSSMSMSAPLTHKLIKHVRQINPDAYIVWGGVHSIIEPEDAIESADAICTGEGEFAFEEFLSKFADGKDFTDTKNFWFNHDGDVIRNQHRPLMTPEEMGNLPLLQYGVDEKIFRPGEGYVPITPKIYRDFEGLRYTTIWTIGCPLHCTFCANTKFIENHSDYTQVRHPSPSYIVDEIERALEVHPHISNVNFTDDSFMALHPDKLRAFAEEYKSRLDIPFRVLGVIPNYVSEERMQILLDAGMNQLRMGIQNGSEEILEFYQRPAPPDRVREAADIFDKYSRYMLPPLYDVIVDNPVETQETVKDNIELFWDLPKPYILNLLSLRLIPNTKLEEQLEERNLRICSVKGGGGDLYKNVPTLGNVLLYLVSTIPLPEWLYQAMLERAKPAHDEDQTFYPRLLILARFLHLIRIGFNYVRWFNFNVLGKRFGYMLWKIGLLDFLRKHFTPSYTLEEDDGGSRDQPEETETTPSEKPAVAKSP